MGKQKIDPVNKERDDVIAFQRKTLAEMKLNSRDTAHWFWRVISEKLIDTVERGDHRK